MKSTEEFGRNSDFRENVTYDLIAPTVIGGATLWTHCYCNGRVHRSIVYEFKGTRVNVFSQKKVKIEKSTRKNKKNKKRVCLHFVSLFDPNQNKKSIFLNIFLFFSDFFLNYYFLVKTLTRVPLSEIRQMVWEK